MCIRDSFKTKKELGVHTEMLTSSIADLVEAGVVTNTRKTLHKGKTIGAFANGTRKLFDYLDGNPSVYMMPTYYAVSYTHLHEQRRHRGQGQRDAQ